MLAVGNLGSEMLIQLFFCSRELPGKPITVSINNIYIKNINYSLVSPLAAVPAQLHRRDARFWLTPLCKTHTSGPLPSGHWCWAWQFSPALVLNKDITGLSLLESESPHSCYLQTNSIFLQCTSGGQAQLQHQHLGGQRSVDSNYHSLNGQKRAPSSMASQLPSLHPHFHLLCQRSLLSSWLFTELRKMSQQNG